MADRGVGNGSTGRRVRSRMESGTCNVCAAPCSSCMHRNAGLTGLNSDDSSDENSRGTVASHCSFNDDHLLPSSRFNALGNSHNTAGEASNLVSSNHDTSSEIAESKETVPSSDHQARNIPRQGKTKDKSGAGNNEDMKDIFVESCTHSDESGVAGKLNKAEEANTSAMSESESADSEIGLPLLDVKVCDTCGDAGREDLLAICSRCSDGAEHTYCMRVMLKKVPAGDWLCEECKFAAEAEKQKLETKRKKETEVNLNTQSKRHIDKPEAVPDAKRQAVEASTGSPKRPVLPRLLALSRETSFKGLEKTTRKLAHHSSFNSRSSDDTESTRSTDSQLHSPKCSFIKSKSFNSSSSRPKVRPVDDVMLKEGFSRNVGRSMSTSTDVSSSGCSDSKVKGSKQLKDRGTEANLSASIVDQKLISRGNSSNSYANSARDLKALPSDSKQGSLTKQARHLSRSRLEDIVASVGDTFTNGKCSSSGKISSEAKRKDEVSHVDGVSRLKDFRETGEKSKDTVGNHQRSDILSVSKGLPSQKGQTAEPTETSCASGKNLSTTRNFKEDINKGNRLRAAVDAALRKKPSFGKNRGSEQSDLPLVSDADPSRDKAFQNLPLKVPVMRDWPVGLQGGHPNLRTDKQTIAVNGKQLTFAGTDTMDASQSVEPEVHLSSVKPVLSDLPVVHPSVLSTTSAIPEHEYIWQGDMEVQKSTNLSAMHCGIQAYISTLASPKVVEVVNQFPFNLTLNEVPRLSTWPSQFQDRGAEEVHVALFFFAKDIVSYEKSYKPLVDNMIQKDLALKGNLEGVELLIFASNQLPQNCQRWNMLYFLWGVFRGKKEKCSNPLKTKPLPASNVLPNMGKAFSTREGFCHEYPSNRESSIDGTSRRMQSCMKTTRTMTTSTGVVLPLMAGTSGIEKHRSSGSEKPRDEMVKEEGDAASLSLSLTFSSLGKEQEEEKQEWNQRSVSGWEHKKQNVNNPLFLYRDKSS